MQTHTNTHTRTHTLKRYKAVSTVCERADELSAGVRTVWLFPVCSGCCWTSKQMKLHEPQGHLITHTNTHTHTCIHTLWPCLSHADEPDAQLLISFSLIISVHRVVFWSQPVLNWTESSFTHPGFFQKTNLNCVKDRRSWCPSNMLLEGNN